MISISLVVIGKNDFKNLSSIYTEEWVDKLNLTFKELIYVDSLSNDNSVEVMKKSGFEVYQLNQNSFQSAAAGRYIGGVECTSDYILFLDSDMELFGLDGLLSEIKMAEDKGFCGVVGDVEDVYPDESVRLRERKKSVGSDEAISFGGFIILSRSALLQAGNWNPYLPANEEIELFARLKKNDFSIYKSDMLMVKHYTVVLSPFKELLGVYIPLRKGRYGAFGYALRSAYKRKALWELCKLFPEPFYFMLCLGWVGYFISIDSFTLTVLPVLGYVLAVLRKRSAKYCVVPPGIFISLWVGLLKYKETIVSYEKK